jgi:IS6 family transposase
MIHTGRMKLTSKLKEIGNIFIEQSIPRETRLISYCQKIGIFKHRSAFKKVLSSPHNQSPRVITVDKNPAYPPAIEQLKDEKSLSKETIIRQTKYLNNIVEQDHRFIKKITNKMMGFKTFQRAEKTIMGIEAFHMLRKQQVEIMPVVSDVEWINKFFGLTG